MKTSQPGDRDFKILDAASYDDHIGSFSRFTTLCTTPLASRMIALASLSPGSRVLDVGTGTGVVAIEAAKTVVGQIVGVDLSEGMLLTARANQQRECPDGLVTFLKMDAEALDFDDEAFDRVLSLFALLHFPDPKKALQEMFRVLKPGGRIVVAIGSGPPWISARGIGHALSLLPRMIDQMSGRLLVAPGMLNRLVDQHIPMLKDEETPMAVTGRQRAEKIMQLVRQAGFTNPVWHWEGHELELPSVSDFWEIQRTFSTRARKRLNSASAEQADAVRHDFTEVCERVLAKGGRLIYPHASYFIVARRSPPSRNG